MSASHRLRVQICNERLISRFGVDRLLVMCGRDLTANGFDVSYACLRYDARVMGTEKGNVQVIDVPAGLDIRGTESHVASILMGHWLDAKPDVLLIGGWPFFELAARAPSVDVPSIFIDPGAVPHDGLSDHGLWPQLEVRRARRTFMPSVTKILPISNFICTTQTLPDRGSVEGVSTILLGSDHLPGGAAPTDLSADEMAMCEQVAAARRAGRKVVMNLGRFEGVGYKNSPQFFEVIEGIRRAGLDAIGLILGDRAEIPVPSSLEDHIICLGAPTDDGLVAMMKLADAALSMSHWEGFNLPLVEFQQLAKPVLAFNAGAHPEVVAHPIQLCRDLTEMTSRAVELLNGESGIDKVLEPALLAFRKRLPWSRTLEGWRKEIRETAEGRVGRGVASRQLVLIDVTNSAADPANSGVVRVTRQVTNRLLGDSRFDVLFVRWDRQISSYIPLDGPHRLASHGGPIDPVSEMVKSTPPQFRTDLLIYSRDPHSSAPLLALLPEVALDGTIADRVRWLRYRGFVISSILYDLIPINAPQYCHADVVNGFGSYLKEMFQFEQCLAISRNSLDDLESYAGEHDEATPLDRRAIWLPAQLGNAKRVRVLPDLDRSECRILCVSTLEPRKNHRTLLAAFRKLVSRRPNIDLKLILIGNRYVGAEELVDLVASEQADGLPLEWLGVVPDDKIVKEYERALFSVYPSTIEGYGLPIMESMWLGRPCVCSDGGVMAELAAEGGCLTVNVQSAEALSRAMERLATDRALYKGLCLETHARRLPTWQDYASEVGDALHGLSALHDSQAAKENFEGDISARTYLELALGRAKKRANASAVKD